MHHKRTPPKDTSELPSSSTTKKRRVDLSVNKQHTHKATSSKLIFLPSLELAFEELLFPQFRLQKIWARHVFENSGMMEFSVATVDEFLSKYSKLNNHSHKYYEIVAEGAPCYGYWDLMFTPHLKKDRVVKSLKSHICTVFKQQYGKKAELSPEDFIVLDSSSEVTKVRLIAKPHSGSVSAVWMDNCFALKAFTERVIEHIGPESENLINMDVYEHNFALDLFHSPKTIDSFVCHVPENAIMLDCTAPDDTGDLPIEIIKATRAHFFPESQATMISTHFFCDAQLLRFSTNEDCVWISLRNRASWFQTQKFHPLPSNVKPLVQDWLVGKERMRLQNQFGGCVLECPIPLAEDGYHLAPIELDVSQGSTHVWISGKGTGKTNLIRDLVSKEAVGAQCTVLAISSHQSMAKFLTSEYGLDCYLDLKMEGWKAVAFSSRLVISEESLRLRTQTNRIPPDILILDEIETLLRHFMSDTMDGKREQAFCDLEYLVSSARVVLVADADFGERGWWFLSRLRTQIKMHCNPPKSTLQYHWIPKKADFEGLVLLHARKKHNLAVVTNSLTEAQYIEHIIRLEDAGGSLLLVSSKTRSDENVERFLEEPRTEAAKYRYLIYTPTIGPGVDISTPVTHFDHIMAFATPQSSCAADFLQQIGRIRSSHSNVVHVCVAQYEYSLETDIDVLHGLVDSHDDSVMKYGVDGISRMQWDCEKQEVQCKTLNGSYVRLWAYNISEKHRSQHNFMGELRLHLWRGNIPFQMWYLEDEFGISEVEFGGIVANNAQEKKRIRLSEIENRRDSFREVRVLTEKEKEELESIRENGEELNEEDETALHKFFVMRFWGLLEGDFETMLDADLDFYGNEDNRDRQRTLEKVIVEEDDTSHLFNEILSLFGIGRFDDSGTIYTKETMDVKQLSSKLLRKRKKIQELFSHADFTQKFETLHENRDLRSVNTILSTLLGCCGLQLHRNERSVRHGKNTGKIMEYSIDSASIEEARKRTMRRMHFRLKNAGDVGVREWICKVLKGCGVEIVI